MADESKLHLAKERGAQAEALMRNELLREAFKTLEAEYVRSWAATQAVESDARENFWRALQILANVEQNLKSVAANGRLAEVELLALAQRFNRVA